MSRFLKDIPLIGRTSCLPFSDCNLCVLLNVMSSCCSAFFPACFEYDEINIGGAGKGGGDGLLIGKVFSLRLSLRWIAGLGCLHFDSLSGPFFNLVFVVAAESFDVCTVLDFSNL